MKPRVGIPRALLYYNYFPMWRIFFEELGAEVVLSGLTNKRILDDGVNCCVDDACLPMKVFHGHIIDLKDRVDYLFVPRLISVEKNEYICPKFCGLPDMVLNTVKGLPRVIDCTINLRNGYSSLRKAVLEVGSLFTLDYCRIYKAYRKAKTSLDIHENLMQKGATPIEAMTGYYTPVEDYRYSIGLIGHSYNIYDNYVSMGIIDKLRGRGIKVLTQDMVCSERIEQIARGFSKPMFWSFGKKIMAASQHLIDRRNVRGIIYLVAFGCGLDALVGDLVERRIRKNGVPFCLLTIDEHTGEAGIDTRLEAFIDMLEWRGARECL
jgi:predicted nucleotide-binding protein (sugar kinase/HSP70/actin superfamily)